MNWADSQRFFQKSLDSLINEFALVDQFANRYVIGIQRNGVNAGDAWIGAGFVDDQDAMRWAGFAINTGFNFLTYWHYYGTSYSDAGGLDYELPIPGH